MARLCPTRARGKMMMLLCSAISMSLLVIFMCTFFFNIPMVTYRHDHQLLKLSGATGKTLCAESALRCNGTSRLAANISLKHFTKRNGIQDRLKATSLRFTTTPIQNQHKTVIVDKGEVALSHTQVKVQIPPGGSGKSYVIVVNFEEQLCSAVYDLYQIANVANSWNMTVVEPYVWGSQFKFQSPPPKITTPQPLRYRDIFDLVESNRLFSRCLKSNHDVITPFEVFAQDAGEVEHVIVLRFQGYYEGSKACGMTHHSKAFELKNRVGAYVRHLFSSSSNNTDLRSVNLINVPHSVVCVDTRNATDFRHLLSNDRSFKLATKSHSNILVLIPLWRGIRTAPHRYFYYDPSYRQPPCGEFHALPQSRRIQSAAEKYRKLYQLDHPFLGVHIRLERLIRRNRYETGYLTRCLEEFLGVLRNVLKSHNNSLTSVAFADYSESGSMTCADIGCRRVAKEMRLEEKLEGLGVTLRHFSPRKFSEPAVSGYVAMTELEVLSRADYLVTVGHGSYHRRMFHHFYGNQGINLTAKLRQTIEDGDGHTLFTVCPHM